MKRTLAALALVTLSGAVFAQQPQNTPTFDAADINLRARTGTTNQPVMTGGVLRGGRYDLRNATMIDLIATAYSIADRDLIAGGPAWLEWNRFDIAAKAPQGTSPADVRECCRTARRAFQARRAPDTRPMTGYVLKIGKASTS
jgi:uncharacterized protein (TIGR03435 family)